MYRLIKTSFNVDAAKAFVSSVQFETPYYVFASNSGEEAPVNKPIDNRSTDSAVYDNMLFGKRVKLSDVNLCAKRYDWVFGTVYDMYDDQVDLSDKQFYVVTDSGIDLNVYKCLYNNNAVPSIVQPFGTSTDPFETLQDGYVWKYMCTINSSEVSKFANITQVPIIEQTDIIEAAKDGSIDVINVEKPGLLYNNYTVGTFGLTSDVRVNGNPLLYALSANASTVNGFYKNCLIRINSNSSTNGQYRLITDYQIVAGRKLITVAEPFDVTPLPADGYEIYPNVFVYDTSATATEPCIARAIVNPEQANSISRIEILSRGLGFRSAVAMLKPDSSVDVLPETSAEVRPIIGPKGGHGSDPFDELNAYFVGISSVFSGNSTPLIANNTFKTVGLLKNPLYANCELILEGNTIAGVFLPGEKIYRYRPIKLSGSVNLLANNLVLGTNTEFTIALRENDRILLTNANTNVFANVTIIDDLTMKLTSNVAIAASNCELYLTPAEYFADCKEFDSPALTLTNVSPVGFPISQFVFGETSQAYARTSNTMPYLTISGRPVDDFSGFNQLIKIEGIKVSTEAFIENEEVTQDLTVEDPVLLPTARVHSYESGANSQFDILYLTDVRNGFESNTSIKTTRSDNLQVVFNIVNKYERELVIDTGEILYLENLNAIRRAEAQVEIVKLYLEF